MELYIKTINFIKNIDDRATLQVFNTKFRISQNTQYAVPKKNNLDWKNNTDSV